MELIYICAIVILLIILTLVYIKKTDNGGGC